jgi:hypothetical protein
MGLKVIIKYASLGNPRVEEIQERRKLPEDKKLLG